MNTNIRDDEFFKIGFFKSQKRVEFSSRLHSYKRNIILVGSFVLFMILGDVHLDRLTAGLISGTIGNAHMVQIFAIGFLIYNYVMFRLYVNKEVSGEDAKRTILSEFTKSVAEYIFQRELNLNLKNKGVSFLSVNKDNFQTRQEKQTLKWRGILRQVYKQ